MDKKISRDEKGRLLAGHGGLKKKGSNNRLQSEIKEKITDFLNGELNTVVEIYAKVSPKDKLRFLAELLGYVLPKSKELIIEESIDENINYAAWPEEDLKALLALHSKNEDDEKY